MSSKLERLIATDALIRAGRYPNARTIAERFEVSERTAYEDQEFLKLRMNAPIEYDPERGGWYYSMSNWALPAFMATEGELMALILSTELAGQYLGSSYEAVLDRAMNSLAQVLPDQIQLDLNELAAHYSFVSGATTASNPRLLQELTIAIRDQRPVRVHNRCNHAEAYSPPACPHPIIHIAIIGTRPRVRPPGATRPQPARTVSPFQFEHTAVHIRRIATRVNDPSQTSSPT